MGDCEFLHSGGYRTRIITGTKYLIPPIDDIVLPAIAFGLHSPSSNTLRKVKVDQVLLRFEFAERLPLKVSLTEKWASVMWRKSWVCNGQHDSDLSKRPGSIVDDAAQALGLMKIDVVKIPVELPLKSTDPLLPFLSLIYKQWNFHGFMEGKFDNLADHLWKLKLLRQSDTGIRALLRRNGIHKPRQRQKK